MKYSAVLKDITLFYGIAPEDLTKVASTMKCLEKTYSRDMQILHQNDPYCALAMLIKGSCKSKIVDKNGKILRVEDFNAPDILAPAVLFAADNRMPGYVTAVKTCRVLWVSKEEVLKLVRAYPIILNNLLQLLSDKFQFISGKLKEFSFLNVREKLLRYLHSLKPDTNGYRTMLHSIEDLSGFFGVSRPSLSRVLQQLTAEGVIRRRNKQILLIGPRKEIQ